MATGITECILLLLLCSISLSLSQNVRMPPGLVVGPTALIYYKEMANVTLHCVGVGSPSPTYEWTKNGNPLNLNAGNIYPTPGVGTIIIYPCMAADQGYYQCKLSNSFGMAMSNMTFLQMATLQGFPPVIETTNYNVDINGHTCLACANPPSIPAPNIYWTYNYTGHTGQPIVIAETASMQTNPFAGELCLTHVQTGDGVVTNNKMYICNSQNTVLNRIQSGSHSKITTSTITTASYAAFLTFGSASSLIGLEGDPLVLRGFFSGSPVPSVTWRKNGQTPPQSRWAVAHSGTGLNLISGRLIQEDAGEFTCMGSNGVGAAAIHTIQLTIHARPVFVSNDLRPYDRNVTEGETVIINCSSYAIPNAIVTWYKNGAVFTSTSLPPKFSLSEDFRTLTITNVCKTCNEGGTGDLMSIQCNASNIYGYGFVQGYLNVLEATMIISVGGDRVWTPYTNEVFDCQATSDDSTPVGRTWYYNDVIVQQSATVIIAANGSLVLLMQNETDGGQSRLGQYRCVASNGYSEAEVFYTLTDGKGSLQQFRRLIIK